MATTPDGAAAVSAMLTLAGAQNLRERAEAGCETCLRTVSEEGDLGELAVSDVQVVFVRCALVFDHHIWSYPFVETKLGLYVADPIGGYFRGMRQIGNYRLITRLDGTDVDEYFVLDERPSDP